MSNIHNYIVAILAGLLPALIWLVFWRREDRRRPEPKGLILLAFISGALAVPMALPLQKWVSDFLLSGTRIEEVFKTHFTTAIIAVILWAFIEEALKLIMAALSVLWRKEVDEPIDPMIYLISTALGFSAVENILFLFNPISNANTIGTIITGDLRFIGASLLHIASSAIIGFFMALGFYRKTWTKRLLCTLGLILSVALHTVFNFFIILSQGPKIFLAFGLVWVAIILILVIFEKAKRIHPSIR